MVESRAPTPDPFQLRGSRITATVLKVMEADAPDFFTRLADKLGQAPGFYRNAPVVLDLADLVMRKPMNVAEWARRLRQLHLIPVGVQNAPEEIAAAAANAGLAVISAERAGGGGSQGAAVSKPVPTTKAGEPPAPAPMPSGAGRVVTEPVRSGRQVYAQGGDLIVLGSVSPGAEILADGHVFVFGALRGRALAGVTGDTGARIFCRSLEAELISIAGFYKVRDTIEEAFFRKDVQIALDGAALVIAPAA